MKKTFNLLNVSIEVQAPIDVINYVESKTYEIPTYIADLKKHKLNYVYDPELYKEIKDSIKEENIIRFYGEEYKNRVVIDGNIYLIDKDSIIIHSKDGFNIIGNTPFSKNHIIYFIREAIYEEYIINNQLLIHSACISNNGATVLVGAPGAGKTTLLMEYLHNTDCNYVSNDLVGCHEKNAMASIIPVRVAHGTLKKYTHIDYPDLREKETYDLDEFLAENKTKLESNVPIKNIVFPKFSLNSNFKMFSLQKDTAFELLKGQTLNFGDEVRPYLWVNEFDINNVNKEIITSRLNDLLDSTNLYGVNYGQEFTMEDYKVLEKRHV